MKLLENFLLERTLKSGDPDRIISAIKALPQSMTEKQENLLISSGNTEELRAYIERFYFGKAAEQHLFCTAPDELLLLYLQKCNREKIPLQNGNIGSIVIRNTNRSLCGGANHELIMQLLYLIQTTSYRVDADSEYSLVCRGNKQELLIFIRQQSFFSAEAENLFLRTAVSSLTDLYSKLYPWHTENVADAIQNNWNEFVRYYEKRKVSGTTVLRPEEEKALLTYGESDFVTRYLSDNGLSKETTDFLIKEGCDRYFSLWMKSYGNISTDTFRWLLRNNEKRAMSLLSHEKGRLTDTAEEILLASGTTEEVLAYIKNHGLWNSSFKKLLKRNVREEILCYLSEYPLISEQFMLLLSRGVTEEITTYVSVCRKLRPEEQLFLIGRGNTDEIKAYLKNRNCSLSQDALLAVQMRGILAELELLPKHKA